MRMILSVVSLILSWLSFVSGNSIVQTFFVPMPEPQLLNTFKKINTKSKSPITTIISIAIASNDTIIYWDHWEDGYELDPANPKQNSTQIWGTGNSKAKFPVLKEGTTYFIRNNVAVTANSKGILYDGGDRISVTNPIAVTRSAFPAGPGSNLTGTIEVFDVGTWSTKCPDTVPKEASGTDQFQYAVMAGFDRTTVTYKKKKYQLNTGHSIFLGPVAKRQTLSSNHPIQVDVISWDRITSNDDYEMRWFC